MASSAMTRGVHVIALRAGNCSQLDGHARVGVLAPTFQERPAAVSTEQEHAGYFYRESTSETPPDYCCVLPTHNINNSESPRGVRVFFSCK